MPFQTKSPRRPPQSCHDLLRLVKPCALHGTRTAALTVLLVLTPFAFRFRRTAGFGALGYMHARYRTRTRGHHAPAYYHIAAARPTALAGTAVAKDSFV